MGFSVKSLKEILLPGSDSRRFVAGLQEEDEDD